MLYNYKHIFYNYRDIGCRDTDCTTIQKQFVQLYIIDKHKNHQNLSTWNLVFKISTQWTQKQKRFVIWINGFKHILFWSFGFENKRQTISSPRYCYEMYTYTVCYWCTPTMLLDAQTIRKRMYTKIVCRNISSWDLVLKISTRGTQKWKRFVIWISGSKYIPF